jgi:hypothetical protein
MQSVRSASYTFKLYFDDSIIETIITETNRYAAKFTGRYKDELKPQSHILL